MDTKPVQDTFRFWYLWLLTVSLVFVLVGVVIALAPASWFFSPWNYAVSRHFFGGSLPEEAAALRSFFMGLLGGTIAGYFLLQSLVVMQGFRKRQAWAWWAVTGALMLWFVVDSARSFHHGAWFNVLMVNLPTLVLVGLPLVMTARPILRPQGTMEPAAGGKPPTRTG
ncbi:MAG: hypothetical protein EA425_06385 [Puniceicoccaceae bacterium]|nr:MAG: hypothetical protein EA425_06385 [Puniceicoccaceae bacterium]